MSIDIQKNTGNEILTSMGQAGLPDYSRSEGRAYQTLLHVINSWDDIVQAYTALRSEALNRGRRRVVLRAECSGDVDVFSDEPFPVPIEVVLPIGIVRPQNNGNIIYAAENFHNSQVHGNYGDLALFWFRHNQLGNLAKTPLDRIRKLDSPFSLSKKLTEDDIDDLYKLWRPFRWTREGVEKFIKEKSDNMWFSGVRDRQTGNLVSACMGESLNFGSILAVEGTEYSTLPEYGGKGLCTAAVVGLNAQVLNDTMKRQEEYPVIIAEFNVASRSDMVGYAAGMYLPNLMNPFSPMQVLRKNVSVLDSLEPNDVKWEELGDEKQHFRDAFRTTHRYWRDFVPGILPLRNIEAYYDSDQRKEILDMYDR